jgi:hypothetical protein
MNNKMKTLLIIPILGFSVSGHSSECQKKYPIYFKTLKNIEKLYKKRAFSEIHYQFRNNFIEIHKSYKEECSNSSKKIVADIKYGNKFYISLTKSYPVVLKRHGFGHIDLSNNQPLKNEELLRIEEPLTNEELLREKELLKDEPILEELETPEIEEIRNIESRLYKVKYKSVEEILKGIIPKNAPLLDNIHPDISSLVKEEERRISLLVTPKDNLVKETVNIESKKYINKKDSLQDIEEDVILIDVL